MRLIRRDPNVTIDRIYTNTGHFRRIVKEKGDEYKSVIWEEKFGTIPVSWEQVKGDRKEKLESKYQSKSKNIEV